MEAYLLKGLIAIGAIAIICAGLLLGLIIVYQHIIRKMENEQNDIYNQKLQDYYERNHKCLDDTGNKD